MATKQELSDRWNLIVGSVEKKYGSITDIPSTRQLDLLSLDTQFAGIDFRKVQNVI